MDDAHDLGFDFRPLPLLLVADDEPLQVCRLTVDGQPHATTGTFHVRRQGAEFAFPLDVPAGASEHEIKLPEVAAPCPAAVELRLGDGRQTADVAFVPVRRWTVFLVNHSHTDIGFTHKVSDVVEVHTKNLERALEFVDATSDWPEETRYRWTCESAWQIQNYLKTHPHQRDRERLVSAVRAGLVEIEALYIHSYFDLLNREQLARSLYLAQDLRDDLGIPITSAMICDVPGCPWSLVDLLAGSGVRYLSMAPNNFIAPFHQLTDLPRPFVWQGPAGGRVLVWYTDDPYWAYIEGARHGFWTGLEEVERKLPAKLAALEAGGYPFDAVQIQTGSDNRPIRLLPATIAREWNRRYLSPRLRVATPSAFFRHAETQWADRLPVVSGEWQSSWSQTTLHYPKEASERRRSHATLDLWERMATAADWLDEAYPYPRAALAEAYDASLLFDEHSGPKGVWRPRSAQEATEALQEGHALFEQATRPPEHGLAAALAAATGALSGAEEPSVVVWNALGWPRGGEVSVALPEAWVDPEMGLTDEATGAAVPFAVEAADDGTRRCRFRAEGVPPIGFTRYRLTADAVEGARATEPAAPQEVSGEEARVAFGHLSIVVNRTGEIIELTDDRTGADLVDRSAWSGLNALVRYLPEPHGPEPGGDFTAATGLYEGTPVEGQAIAPVDIETEPLAVASVLGNPVVRAEATIAGTYRRQVEIRVCADRVEIANRLSWLRRPDAAEVLFVIFPFAMADPEIRHAAQYAIVDPQRQTLSGGSLDSFAVQHWLDLSSGRIGVTVCSPDLALVDYGGINLQRFLRRLDVRTGCLAFRAANGRALPPPDGDPFGVGATMAMRFVVRPYAGAFDSLAAGRFGEEQALPLLALPLPAHHPGEWKDRASSFVALRSPTCILTGLKRAERADGYVVRLWESTGRRSVARLSFPRHTLLAAWRLTPAEGEIGRAELSDGGVDLELAPFESATLRVVLGR